MLDRDDLLRIALRYDTAVSRAMLRALGHQGAFRKGRTRKTHPGGARARGERRKYAGMMWCFRNPTSPMDWH